MSPTPTRAVAQTRKLRHRAFLLSVSCVALGAMPAQAQSGSSNVDAPQAASAAQADPAVVVYESEFFAPGQPNTAFDMVRRIPGFVFSDGDAARGFAGTGSNTLIDGRRPASKSESMSSLLSRIPSSQVERIELIRSGARGVDMQDWSVIANVVRRRRASQTQSVTAQASVMDDGRFIPTLRYERSSRNGDASHDFSLQTGGFVDFAAGDGLRTRSAASGNILELAPVESDGDGRTQSLLGNLSLPLRYGRLALNGNLSRNAYDFEEQIYRPSGLEVQEVEQRRVSGEMGASWEHALAEGLRMELLGIQRVSEHTMGVDRTAASAESLFRSESTSGESIVRLTLRGQALANLTLEGGAEGAFNFLDRETSFTLNGNPVTLPSAAVRVEELRGEAFAQARWRLHDSFSAEIGGRYELSRISQAGDVSSSETLGYMKPRALATWSPADDYQLRFLIEREVGQLDFGDFVASAERQFDTISAGNPELRPDRWWLFEAAFERTFEPGGRLVVALRHRDIEDARDRVPIFYVPSCEVVDGEPLIGFDTCTIIYDGPGNIGEGWARELQLTLTLPLEQLGISGGRFGANAIFRESEVQDPTTEARRPISNEHEQEVTVSFSQDLPHLRLSWGLDVNLPVDMTEYRVAELRRTEYDAVVMGHVNYRLTEQTSVRLTVNNASRYSYQLSRSLYDGNRATGPLLFTDLRDLTMGRNFQIRLRHSF